MPGDNERALIGFNQELNALMRRHWKKANRTKQRVAIDVLAQLIERSPVDTRFFSVNWQATLHAPTEAVIELEGASAQSTMSRGVAAILASRLEDNIWYSNNADYADALEAGHSGQAPAGVVGPTIESARQALVDFD